MQPRYFVGITLPDDLSQTIVEVQSELFGDHKIMAPLRPHITLIDPNTLMTVHPLYFIPKAKEAVSEILPIEIELAKTEMFDKRILHIEAKSPQLNELRQKLVELLPEKVQAQYEIGRKFMPHVTLAQAKPKQTLECELVAKFKQLIDPQLPQAFTTTRLSQFKRLKPRTYQVDQI